MYKETLGRRRLDRRPFYFLTFLVRHFQIKRLGVLLHDLRESECLLRTKVTASHIQLFNFLLPHAQHAYHYLP